jgi:cellobiose phosphorylase
VRVSGLKHQTETQFNSEREFIMAQIEITATRMSEKFVAIDGQFAASKTAVDAALSAAKEAVAEQNKANSAAIKVSEGNTKEQLTSLGQVSSANFKAMEDKIADARDRLTSIESITRGIKEAGGEGRADRGLRANAISAGIAALATLVALVSLILYATKH